MSGVESHLERPNKIDIWADALASRWPLRESPSMEASRWMTSRCTLQLVRKDHEILVLSFPRFYSSAVEEGSHGAADTLLGLDTCAWRISDTGFYEQHCISSLITHWHL
ncbi:hypothetical protein O3P69_005949 [Scylla paramamosain]|uniref:Uncharacterized protein n=1 Tax=Scylla paramamosain TaxID=85552 RepID=A0AAW0U511_SCYPA